MHQPTLRTILMVETVLKKARGPLSREQLKHALPRQVMHPTLNTILSYLEERHLILDTRKGIIWLEPRTRQLAQAIAESVPWDPEALRVLSGKRYETSGARRK